MPFSGKIGDTVRLRDTGAKHRYIILTKPNHQGDVVILNFTTAKHFEWLVTFSPRDDKRLFTERCTPNYHDARLYPIDKITIIANNNPSEYRFCPENLTLRIIIGAFKSRHTSTEIIDELKKQYPDEYNKFYRI